MEDSFPMKLCLFMNKISTKVNEKIRMIFSIFSKEWQILKCLLFIWTPPHDTNNIKYFSNFRGTIFPYIIFSAFLSGILEVFLFRVFIKHHHFHGWFIVEDLNIVLLMYILSIFKSLFFFHTSITKKIINIRYGVLFNVSIPLGSISAFRIIPEASNTGEKKLWKIDHPNIRIDSIGKDKNIESFEFRLDNPK